MAKRRRSHQQPHEQPLPPPPLRSPAASLDHSTPRTVTSFPNHFVDPLLHGLLDVVDSSTTSPSDFFSRYIATRTPCVLSPPSPLWPCWHWSNSELCREAGDCVVQVEQRSEAASGFGYGGKVSMRFEQLVRRLESGDSSVYLTTQYPDDAAEASDSGGIVSSLRYLLAPPLTHLLGDFPLHPPLLAALIPTQFNLWLGHAARKTSSRLHHDFHCNLYALLRGRKHITLVSPCHTHRMELSGAVREVKRNGLICYHGDGMHEDASTDTERRQERKTQLEEAIAQLERDIQQLDEEGSESAVSRATKAEELQAAEAELDELLDDILDEEGADGGEDGDNWQDDSEAEDGGATEVDDGNEEGDDAVSAAELSGWRQWSADSSKRPSLAHKQKPQQATNIISEREAAEPPNFSALSAATLPADLPRVVVQLSAPALLYIPCGWFHEVESESEPVDPAAGGGEKGHCALNVWFLPPDQLDEQQPYSQQRLWQERWRRQRRQLDELAAHRAERRQTNAVSAKHIASSKHVRQSGGVFGRRGWRKGHNGGYASG